MAASRLALQCGLLVAVDQWDGMRIRRQLSPVCGHGAAWACAEMGHDPPPALQKRSREVDRRDATREMQPVCWSVPIQPRSR
jgi:hypothetical protein